MKFTIVAIAFAFCMISNAQNFPPVKLGEQAVFKHCMTEADPILCTEETFKNLITNLITPEITQEIANSPEKDGFYVSILFITDENGKVINSETEIICANNALHVSIRNIISRLPAFFPKSDKMAIRKSAHLYNINFVPDLPTQTYQPGITFFTDKLPPQLLKYNEDAKFKDCKEKYKKDVYNKFPCLYNPLSNIVLKNFKIPGSESPSRNKLIIYFTVNASGEIVLTRIMEGTEELRGEMARQFKMLPKIEPALIKGIPTVQSFVIPFTINID